MKKPKRYEVLDRPSYHSGETGATYGGTLVISFVLCLLAIAFYFLAYVSPIALHEAILIKEQGGVSTFEEFSQLVGTGILSLVGCYLGYYVSAAAGYILLGLLGLGLIFTLIATILCLVSFRSYRKGDIVFAGIFLFLALLFLILCGFKGWLYLDSFVL